jgi:dTDP-4-amino-4,6-dideoxygalactose transaminase
VGLSEALTKKGIGNGVYYPIPLHLQPCYRFLGYKKGDLPVSEEIAEHILSLPMYPELSKSDQRVVVRAVREFFGKK